MARKFIVAHEDERVAAFVMSRNDGMELGDSPYTAIGQADGQGNLLGGVVFNNFTKKDIHMHVAGVNPRWLTRRFLGECYRYVFNQLGCRRATVMIDEANERSLKFCRGLGYVYEGTLRCYLPNGNDCHVLGMLREECRWLKVGELSNGLKQPIPPTVAALRQRERTPLKQTASVQRSSGL
jgi:RimJ/RimL family protein N-acetyltransferase